MNQVVVWVIERLASSMLGKAILFLLVAALTSIGFGIYEFEGWMSHPLVPITAALVGGLAGIVLVATLRHRKPEPTTGTSPIALSIGMTGNYVRSKYENLYAIRKVFMLKMENTDRSQSLRNCSVKVLSVEPDTGYRGPWILKSDFNLSAGDHMYIPVVNFGEAAEPEKGNRSDTFAIMGTPDGRPTLDTATKFTITIRATAEDAAYADLRMSIWVENQRMQVLDLTQMSPWEGVD